MDTKYKYIYLQATDFKIKIVPTNLKLQALKKLIFQKLSTVDPKL